MDETQLLEFYTGGGDLTQLSDADLQTLAGMMKVGGAGQSAPPSLIPSPGTPAPQAGPSNIGSTDPKEFIEWLASSVLQGLGVGAGLTPAGLPLRMGMTGLFGAASGAADPAEGQGRLESALESGATQAGLEGVAGVAAKALPWVGHQAAVRMGVPPAIRSGGRTREIVESFLNERRRGGRMGWGKTPAVGQKTTALRKATGQPNLKDELTQKMGNIKEQLPERITPFSDVRERALGPENRLRDPDKFLGLDAPMDTARNIESADTKFWDQTEDLLGHMQGLSGPRTRGFQSITTRTGPFDLPEGNYLPPPSNTLPGEVETELFRRPGIEVIAGPRPNVNFGELVEMAQKQGASAAPTFERTASGSWVRASDTPEKLAARERNRVLKEEAERTARAQPEQGGNQVADDYLETNERLSDSYRIERVADKLRRGLAFAGIRGGLGAGLGSAVGMGSGGLIGAGMGGPMGGALGLLATPGNVSRAGSLGGRLAEVTPSAWRIFQLIQELENPPVEKPVQVRSPK